MKNIKLFQESELFEVNSYSELFGTKIFINKFFDEENYRVFFTNYYNRKDIFIQFLKDENIKYTKDSETYVLMDKSNVDKLKEKLFKRKENKEFISENIYIKGIDEDEINNIIDELDKFSKSLSFILSKLFIKKSIFIWSNNDKFMCAFSAAKYSFTHSSISFLFFPFLYS